MLEKKRNTIPVLSFILLDTHLCIDLHYIIKVLPLLMLESVPNSENYLVGLMNIENKISPVMDLALRLGMERTQPYTINTPILYCMEQEQSAGLIVDEVIGLRHIDQESIQQNSSSNTENSAFRGVSYIDGHTSLILNMKSLFPIQINRDHT